MNYDENYCLECGHVWCSPEEGPSGALCTGCRMNREQIDRHHAAEVGRLMPGPAGTTDTGKQPPSGAGLPSRFPDRHPPSQRKHAGSENRTAFVVDEGGNMNAICPVSVPPCNDRPGAVEYKDLVDDRLSGRGGRGNG